jgi:hypothetical protein
MCFLEKCTFLSFGIFSEEIVVTLKDKYGAIPLKKFVIIFLDRKVER